MLTFTAAGVVSAPEALQIRMADRYLDRVRAGAPWPTRRLTDDELRDNLRWFTVGQRGPRSSPATRLVLTGLDDARRPVLGAVVAEARALGIAHVVVHAGRGEVAAGAWGADAVVRLAVPGEAPPGPVEGVPTTTVVELAGEAGAEPVLDAVASGVDRVVLTWPFAPDVAPTDPDLVRVVLARVAPEAEVRGVALHLVGLPPCMVGGLDTSPRRARNRWYVDADHQREAALLFFPDVARFAKADTCRFCVWDARCDGVAETWWRGGHATLEPIAAPGGGRGAAQGTPFEVDGGGDRG